MAAVQAYVCDAKIATVVTGHLDPEAVAAAVRAYLGDSEPGAPPGGSGGRGPRSPGGLRQESDALGTAAASRLGATLVRYATAMVSGPGGLAAALRGGLPGPLRGGISLPLDITSATATVPPHLRRRQYVSTGSIVDL
jgi:hypothetical protein